MSAEPLIESDLLEEIVCALVERPEEVRIEEITNDNKTTLRIHTHPQDVGHVIGRKGTTVRILRQLFAVLAGKLGPKNFIFIEVAEAPHKAGVTAEATAENNL